MERFVVDVDDVLVSLFRMFVDPGITVMTRIPDRIPEYVPLVVVHRAGGGSDVPNFYDEPLFRVQVWVAPTPEQPDARRGGSDLADMTRGILWRAYRHQVVVPGKGHLVSYHESQAPLEIGDENMPSYGRFVATYRIKIRPPRR